MERRDLMLATGALALAGVSQAAPDAGPAPGKPPGLVELRERLHPGRRGMPQAHCLQQFAAGDTSLAACAKSVAVMLQMCRALVTAAAQARHG